MIRKTANIKLKLQRKLNVCISRKELVNGEKNVNIITKEVKENRLKEGKLKKIKCWDYNRVRK